MIILVSCAIRASVILVVGLGLVRLLGKRTASLRHAVLAIAMACVAIAPALGLLLPAWTPTIVTWPSVLVTSPGVELGPLTPDRPDAVSNVPTAVPTRQHVVDVSAPEPPTRDLQSASPITHSVAHPLNIARLLEAIYLAGAAVVFATLIAGLLRLVWLTARSEPNHDDLWQLQLTTIAQEYGVRRSVRLRRSRHPSVLAAWGIVRPQILLPAGSEDWPSDCTRVVLLHELAHIRRHDWIVQILAGVLRAVYWFNPLIWIASSRLRHESERACDDLVVSHDVDAHEYAGHLLTLARLLNRGAVTWTPAPSMAGPSSLRQRIAAILDPAANHARARRSAVASVAALLLLITAPVAALHVAVPAAPRATSTPPAPRPARLDASRAAIVITPPVNTIAIPAAPAVAATRRAPSPLAPDLSPVDPSPKTTAIAVLDLIQSTPLSDPASILSAHTFLRSNVDTLQRAARAVIDDDGDDPSSARTKSRVLLDAITNTANAATSIANRANTSPETRSALTELAAALRTQAADLRAIIPPIVVPAVDAGASPARQAAVAALNAVQTARGDGPLWEHAFLATQLEAVERAAQSVLDDDGTSERATAARPSALSNALLAAANAASNIGGRANETEHVRGATADLAATLRTIAGQVINAVQTAFAIHLPPDVEPERVAIFYSLALSGRMPDTVTTKSGVFDYTIDTKAAHDLKLLIVVPGYRIVTAQFTDAQMRSAPSYTPRLIPSSTILRGRLVDSSRRPIRNFGLTLSYELDEAVDYFCGNCGLDGQFPTIRIDGTRTDDAGGFSLTALNVSEDPFFQGHFRYVGTFYVSSTARGERFWLPWGDDTLQPSRIDARSITVAPLVVTHVDHGILSGRLGTNFLQQHGLAESLTSLQDARPRIQFDAASKNGDFNGAFNLMLKEDGSFEVSLRPGTYDLDLSIFDGAGDVSRTIPVSTRVIVRENQRTVVERP